MQRNTLNSHFPIATPDRSACSISRRQLLPASACNVHRWMYRLWRRRALVSQLRNSQFPCQSIWLLYAHFCAKNELTLGRTERDHAEKKCWIPNRFISRCSHYFAYRFGSVIVINGADEKEIIRVHQSHRYTTAKPQQLTFSQISHRNHFECTWIGECKRNSAMRFVKLQREHPFQLN